MRGEDGERTGKGKERWRHRRYIEGAERREGCEETERKRQRGGSEGKIQRGKDREEETEGT
jgi:hypothetical protein